MQVPYVEKGDTYKVQVKSSMKSAKKSSRFYSVRCAGAAVNSPHSQAPRHAPQEPTPLCGRSIFAGLKNNIMGMVGFVREGRKGGDRSRRHVLMWPHHVLCLGRDDAEMPHQSPLSRPPAVLFGIVDVCAIRFKERIDGETELMQLVAAKKAAKVAAAEAGQKQKAR